MVYNCFSKIVFICFIILLSYHPLLAGVDNIPILKDGDLVFQTINSKQTNAIIIASNSQYTHVGIIEIDKNNNPYVIEAVGPVRRISLKQWIKQGIGEKLSIRRLNSLGKDNSAKVLTIAKSYLGRPYDFFFYFDKEKIYCSELIYYAFQEILPSPLGNIQTVNQLYIDNPIVKPLIKSRWRHHPLCKSGKLDFKSCYLLILKEKLITPGSIYNDHRLETIYSNYE